MTDNSTFRRTYILVRGHKYVCDYRDLFRAMGRWAVDPRLDFGWDDYLKVIYKLRQAECDGVVL